jgi:hypothetical protein
MPSWNIHSAHVEQLLREEPAEALGIVDKNIFLFGNFVPDVYVGYVVSPISHKIEYRDTHFAATEAIPAPNASSFYKLYVRDRKAGDLELGAWAHLICDHYYNQRTKEYIARIGVKPGTEMRIRKQADFDLFGRTLDIERVPEATPELFKACAHFAQYPIDEQDVRAAIVAEERIVSKNIREHVAYAPTYSLLTPEFFSATYTEVDNALRTALHAYANGLDASSIGRS